MTGNTTQSSLRPWATKAELKLTPNLKTCKTCGFPKPEGAFPWNGGGATRVRSPHCSPCNSARIRERRAARRHLEAPPTSLNQGDIRTKKAPVPHQPIQNELPVADSYVFTYAQNATPTFTPFLKALEGYCKVRGSCLVVIPGRYKNPTSIYSTKMEHDEWWDEALHPYLFNGRSECFPKVAAFGDISIQPTASRPLWNKRLVALVGQSSGIFGHPTRQFRTVATATRRARLLTTTGAITVPNYTDSLVGKQAAAHHVMGAVVVERSASGLFHIRHISACEDGSFIDVATEYTSKTHRPAGRAKALVCGDIHREFAEDEVLDATLYASSSIAHVTKPEVIVYHDTLHFARRNHHTINNFQDRYDRFHGAPGYGDVVEDEVQQAVEFIDNTPAFARPFVVASNHDEAFDVWLDNTAGAKDPPNARFWHEANLFKLDAREKSGRWPSAFEVMFSARSTNPERATFWSRDEDSDECRVGDIELKFHGDTGVNGTYGSANNLSGLGCKTIIGHSHSPCIIDGCYQVGVTGALDQKYNNLPSSWHHTHCLVYANNKRALIHVIRDSDGRAEWRA